MKRTLFSLAALMSLCLSATTQADDALVGEWFAETTDGRVIELSIEASSKFVFDEQQRHGLERVYMCGVWSVEAQSLALDVHAYKERLANGQIEQLVGHSERSFGILSSKTNSLVLHIDNRTIALQRVVPRRG
jgi:hypothetical protein